MVKDKRSLKKGVFSVLIFAVGFLLCACCLIPFYGAAAAREERYEAVWQDGTVTEESYASAYGALCGAEEGELLLERDGRRGTIGTSARYQTVRTLLKEGSLPDLLTLPSEGLSPLERAALYREFCTTGYYSADLFAYDGSGVSRTRRTSFCELVLLDGSVPASVVCGTGAEKLSLRSGAMFSASALIGSDVREIAAEAPYAVQEGAVYLSTASGRRLVAGLPHATELTADHIAFCDKGALSPCAELVSLCLPFTGSAEQGGSDGRLLWAFGERLPKSLKRVKITGGTIPAFAFTGCGGVEELDLCGIPAEKISASAFAGCTGLIRLHTKIGLSLNGFVRSGLPCGCFLYERSNIG